MSPARPSRSRAWSGPRGPAGRSRGPGIGPRPGEQRDVNATTDQDGRFRIDGLPKVASYRIQADPRPGEPYFPVSTEVTDTDGLNPISVTFDLPKGVVVRVRLIDKATGKAVAGHNV